MGQDEGRGEVCERPFEGRTSTDGVSDNGGLGWNPVGRSSDKQVHDRRIFHVMCNQMSQ